MNTEENNKTKLSLPESVKYMISGLIMLLGIGFAAALYLMQEEAAKVDSDALVPLVETAAIEAFEGDLDLAVSGTVVPFREIRVAAEVGGKIAAKHCDCEAGNFIKAGTTLLEIDSQDYELDLKMIDAEIVQAMKTYQETLQEIDGASKSLQIASQENELQKSRFQRTQRLKNSLSKSQVDDAKRSLLSAESQFVGRNNTYEMLLKKKERLDASLELIKSRREMAELKLSRTIVKAPVDGVIVREAVEQGDFVTAARELIVFEDTSRAEVLCNLTPGELEWLRTYAPTEASSDPIRVDNHVYNLPKVAVQIYDQAEPDVFWEGILERFDGIGRNETTKSIPCRIVVEKPIVDTHDGQRVLVRGMFVKCRIVLSSEQADCQLGSFPLVGVRPGDYVWVVRDDKLNRFDIDVIDRTPLRQSLSEKKRVVIQLDDSGLQIGDQVVVSPLPQPTQGGRVLTSSDSNNTDSITPEVQHNAESTDSVDDVLRTNVPKQAATSSQQERSRP